MKKESYKVRVRKRTKIEIQKLELKNSKRTVQKLELEKKNTKKFES